eukprot:UN11117
MLGIEIWQSIHCVTLDHFITFQKLQKYFFNSSSISNPIPIFRIFATSMGANIIFGYRWCSKRRFC